MAKNGDTDTDETEGKPTTQRRTEQRMETRRARPGAGSAFEQMTLRTPPGLRRALRLEAIERGISMHELVLPAVEKLVPGFGDDPGGGTKQATKKTRGKGRKAKTDAAESEAA